MSEQQGAELGQWALIRLNFARHHLADWALVVLAVIYLHALFAEIFAPRIHWQGRVRSGASLFSAAVGALWTRRGLYGKAALRMQVDPVTFRHTYYEDPSAITRLAIFARGEPYRLLGMIPMSRPFHRCDRNLPRCSTPSAPTATDATFSARIIFGARVSLSVGLVGIVVTFLLGMTIGGISGYAGGRTDNFIQRSTRSRQFLPQLPLWMAAFSAVLPDDWSPLSRPISQLRLS